MAGAAHEHTVAGVDVHDEAARRLAAIGSKYTSKRRLLVDVFVAADHPLALPEVIAADRSLAQSSAYRNLSALELAGVVRRIVTDDDFARFELAEAVSGHHHHHLICTTCGAIEDFTLPPELERSLAEEFDRVSRERDFDVTAHQVDLVGRCAQCNGR